MRIMLIAIFLSLFFVVVNMVSAQSTEPESTVSASPDNSYILFWPLTAGKTEGDSLYSLKLFKEQIGGLFIFGDMKKADYAVLLASKRVLEAEKLIKDGKLDSALKTLGKAENQLSIAYNHVKNQALKDKVLKEEIRKDRLLHIKSFVDYLKTIAPTEAQETLEGVKESADVMLRDYLP